MECVSCARSNARSAGKVRATRAASANRIDQLSRSLQAASGDVVVVATPWDGVLATIAPLEEKLAGKIVISMANAVTRWGKEMVPLLPPTGSVTLSVARALPRSRVVGAFHHMPAGPWGDLDHPLGVGRAVDAVGGDVQGDPG